jgi:hypothetical protein
VEQRKSLPTPTPAPSRKLTSPFSWLSRTTSSKKPEPSLPTPSERRNTNASVATLASNPESALSRIEDEDTPATNRTSQHSLRDRFKILRMREEAGIAIDDESGTSVGLGIASTGAVLEEKDEHVPAPRTPSLARQSTVNPALAPGTAAGIAVGPAGESAEPVDWDLWQSVVNEGPAAVARTSAEELNSAIASGIPQAIRGVIWQVLAQSKNEDLENMYRELVARGTDKEYPSNKSPPLPNGLTKEKESVASSASSIHSDYSTPATTNGSMTAPLGSPAIVTDNSEDAARLQTKLGAEKQQRAKDDTAAVQKLERTIKRDLGARTSYSKYLMAAGLQDGLFGICKAYALYDEAVGYAQGMNFIAMPLLFNVS